MKKTTKLPTEKLLRHQLSFEHDLFKLSVTTFKRNVSWKYLQPQLVEAEHVHFFHTKNSKGMPQKYCHSVGGHFHEVSVDWETRKATCGPALTKKTIKIPNTSRTVNRIVQVEWDAVNMSTGVQNKIVDDHTHDVDYMHSETMSEATTQAMHAKDRERIAPMINADRMASQGEALKKLSKGELSNSKADQSIGE